MKFNSALAVKLALPVTVIVLAIGEEGGTSTDIYGQMIGEEG